MTFAEVLDEYRVPYVNDHGHHHARAGWLQLDCPQCSPGSGRYRLGYNKEYKYANCWVCGGVPVLEVLKTLTGESVGKCFTMIGGLDFERARKIAKPIGTLALPPHEPMGKAHRRYLEGRGFDPDEVERLWDVRGIGKYGGLLRWRLLIPIRFAGETVSWTTRAITDDPRRYLSASGAQEKMNHKDLLYGEEYVRHGIIIHEGPTDVWATGPGAVCTSGLSFTTRQVERMVAYPVRAVCFDAEPAAQRRARRLVNLLAPFVGETSNVLLETGKDAASASSAERRELRRRFLGASK